MKEELYKLKGPVLLLAGPGTGKTYNIAKRLKYLIEEKEVNPENTTVITFTGLAARNMRNEISDVEKKDRFIPIEDRPSMICTIHSLGYRIIKEKSTDLNFNKNIEIVLSLKLQKILVEDAANILGYRREIASEILECRKFADCKESSEIKCEVCKQYEKILRCCNAIDYNDQILLACKILKDYPDVKRKYQSFCKHLLVDEYQDINTGQFELIKILSKNNLEGLFVVGDDDQSIYSWRGGSPMFIRNFENHFGKDANVKTLRKSFRCPKNILICAYSVVKKYDDSHIDKGKFEYTKKDLGEVIIHNMPSEDKEAIEIRTIIEKKSPADVLVLIPNRLFLVPIIKEFKKSQINYQTLFQNPGEGLPLISTIYKFYNDNSDNLSFRECLDAYTNSPIANIPSSLSRKKEKLDKRNEILSKFSILWQRVINKKAKSLFEALEIEKEKNELYKKSYKVFKSLKSVLSNEKSSIDCISEIIRDFGIWKKVLSFIDESSSWVETFKLLRNINSEANVVITTYQGAKGLGADIVFLVGLEDGVVPRSDISVDELAEQSRLMFVSMTRSKKELHLFHVRKRSGSRTLRNVYKKGEKPNIKPSCFISCLPTKHIRKIDHWY